MITVIGAGAGGKDNLTLKAFETLKNADKIILQTARMPLKTLLDEQNLPYTTLDALYEESEDFDELNRRIAEKLTAEENAVYVVFGHALDDSAVALLPKEIVSILPGVSLADAAASFCAFRASFKTFTAVEILAGALPDTRFDAVVTCIDSALIASDVTVRLTELYGDEYPALYYKEDADGTPHKKAIALYEANAQEKYDHTSCLLLEKAPFGARPRYDIRDLLYIVRRLAARDGCPWDSVQTHESLRPFMIEEAYEAVDAIDKNDPWQLADELGDVLLQVTLHAEIGTKCGEFDFTDVTDAVCRKMIRRHPAVFGTSPADSTWDEIKMQEKGMTSEKELLEAIPEVLPALAYAEKLQYKTGLSALDAEAFAENIRKTTEWNEETLGELLFDAVRFCRSAGVHPEPALNKRSKALLKEKTDR